MADLAELQRQFYGRVVGREPDADLIGSGDVDIYARMYASRLYDTLADDYPKLRVALGEQRFGDLVARFFRAHPPRSFTLRDAGTALADFVRGAADPSDPAWAADLAALERARIEVFDGPDAVPLVQDEVAALADELPDLVLSWVPSSLVVPLAWAVDDLWSAIEDGQATFQPAGEPRMVLVWRRDITVLHRTLDADEARLAPQIARGALFSEVCGVLGEIHGDQATARAVELLLRWLAASALDGSPDRARGRHDQ
jgi:hypothetical protein